MWFWNIRELKSLRRTMKAREVRVKDMMHSLVCVCCLFDFVPENVVITHKPDHQSVPQSPRGSLVGRFFL